ncbi:MAG: (d)CMP kinase [Synergistes sp.]|nr:(d)CMP kinase [Synergistes sp.]
MSEDINVSDNSVNAVDRPNETHKIIVTIDGPAGAGKSTVARAAAKRIGLPYLDTGALYRGVAWRMNKDGINADEGSLMSEVLTTFKLEQRNGKLFADGVDITSHIRTPEIDRLVSVYAARPEVRNALVDLQRSQAVNGLVADGRDMGTVVFPEAELKIFLTASAEERARRRCDERIARGEKNVNYDEVLRQVIERDRYDMEREIAPLRPAQGCIILDTTDMSIEEVIDAVTSLAKEFMRQ